MLSLISSNFVFQIIWRIGTEILHHHPNSTLEDYNSFYERVKHSGVKHYLKVGSIIDLLISTLSAQLKDPKSIGEKIS